MTGNYNGSVCEYLAAFLDDGPKTSSYDWRDALENLNELFGAIYTYGNVSKPVSPEKRSPPPTPRTHLKHTKWAIFIKL